MADRKISDLTALTTPATGDLLPIVDVSEAAAADKNKKITVQELFKGVPDGTAAAPGLAFESDDGNGIYLAGTDTVAISTGGTQRLSVNASGLVTIAGDLQVEGTTTTIESTTVTIDDKNIELGSVDTPSDTTADGGGITLKGATDKTINWVNSTDAWTSSERFNFPAGTAAAPSVILNGDVNSGLYQPGADQVAISTGGSARLYISGDGDVGVNTTSPTAALTVVGRNVSGAPVLHLVANASQGDYARVTFYESDGTTSNAYINSDGSNGLKIGANNGPLNLQIGASSALTIDTSSRVGIGTSSPGSWSTYTNNLVVRESGNDPGGITIATNSGYAGYLGFSDTGNTSSQGWIGYRHDNATEGLELAAGSSARMYITSAGNVGIGETTPEALLEIRGASTVGTKSGHIILSGDSATSGQGPQIVFSESGSGASYAGAYIGHIRSGTNSQGHIVFGVRTSAGDANTVPEEAMRITDQKRVGIGTTVPGALLNLRDAAPALRLTADANDITELQFGDTGDTVRGNIVFRNGTGGNALCFHASNNNEYVRLDSSGRLLVGTTSARSTAGFGSPRLQLVGDYQSSILLTDNSNNTNSIGLVLSKIRGSSIVQNGDPLGYVTFAGYDGSIDRAGAYVQANVDGTPGAGDMPTRLVFSTTADGAASPTERVRIESNGRTKFSNSAYGVERTATASAFDLATGNFWTCGAIAIPNPTNQVAGLLGSLRVTAAPVSFAGDWQHPGGSYTAPTSFPAVAPFFVQASGTILLGSWTEGIA